MTMLDSVFDSLQAMTLIQLLCGFLACMCYAALQGHLLDGRIKWVAGTVSLVAAIGFVLASEEWVYGFMLLAFAIAGLGVFAAAAWLLGGLLGFNGRRAPQVVDSAFVDPAAEPRATVPAGLGSHPVAASRWTAPSH